MYIDDKGTEIEDSYTMAINYIKSSFVLDLLATVPFDEILSISSEYQKYKLESKRNGNIPWVNLFALLKIIRVLRLNSIIDFLNSSEDTKSILRVTKMIIYLVIYIHCSACTWWFVVK